MQNWKKLLTGGVIWAGLGCGVPAFGQAAASNGAPESDRHSLPEAPRPKVIDRRFVAVYGILASAKAADMLTTSRNISRGCVETDPMFAGPRPSDRRLALTAGAYFAGEVALGYGLKKLGQHHRWARALWLIEPSYQASEHTWLALKNASESCRR